MWVVKIIFKYVLNLKGYSVIKNITQTERKIYNAYYFGNCFKCIKGDSLTEDILLGKVWDPQIPEILKLISPQSGVVVEIGANIGTSILPHTQNFPELQFKLYEPVPTFYNLLIENHKTFNFKKNSEIFQIAFGDNENETIEINVGLGTAGKTKLVHYQMIDQKINVPSRKFDSFFQNEKISFIKLDVDGYEFTILKGAENILKSQHPMLFIEFSAKLMVDINQSPYDIINLLKSIGYNQIKIWDNEANFIKTTSDWDELIFHANATPHYLNILVSYQ